MKGIIRSLVVNGSGLYAVTLIVPSIRIPEGNVAFVTSTIALSLLLAIVKPVLELILLPINILTMGMFRWVSMTLVFWMMASPFRLLSISPYHFSGFSSQGIVLPEMTLSLFWTTVLVAFLFTALTSFAGWVISR